MRRRISPNLYIGYGFTEAGMVSSATPAMLDTAPDTIGVPLREVEFQIVDDEDRPVPDGSLGHMRVRGAGVVTSYLNAAEPEQTGAFRDGWFYPGDMALKNSAGLVFHKGRHLFGADIARTPAAKAAEVIVAEGYTDVIAMHQAGLRNTVGLMGTALTDEQVGELARLAPTVLLALDADAAGQEAMLRGARVAARRNLTLRVVPLPVGSDPADLVAAEGARAMADRVDASVPFVRFRVERELAAADLSRAEGKDAVIAALRPVFRDLPAGDLQTVACRLQSVKVEPGSVVVRQGGPADKFFIIVEGEVDVLREDDGEERTINTLGPGDYFGEVAILRDSPRIATVKAKPPTTLLAMDRDSLRSLVAGSLGTTEEFDRVIRERMTAAGQTAE